MARRLAGQLQGWATLGGLHRRERPHVIRRRRLRAVALITCLLFAFQPFPATARVLGGAFDAVLTQPPITPRPPVPAALKGLQYGNPAEGIGLIEPPTPDNTGEAQTSYPLDLPPGRLDWQPNLALNYGSRVPNGWLGVGWDLSVPSITVDTRWGVPRYEGLDETETYSFEGEQLSPTAHRGDKLPRQEERIFIKRVEGDYPLIIRHGTHPTNYWWEVHDKVGNKFFYGRTEETDIGVPEAVLARRQSQRLLVGPGRAARHQPEHRHVLLRQGRRHRRGRPRCPGWEPALPLAHQLHGFGRLRQPARSRGASPLRGLRRHPHA